jgi:hypothetical protein
MKKKFLGTMILVSLVLIGCASTPTGPIGNPFIGEWGRAYERLDTVLVFTENQFTITEHDGRVTSGTYTFGPSVITLTTETSGWSLRYNKLSRTRIHLSCIA